MRSQILGGGGGGAVASARGAGGAGACVGERRAEGSAGGLAVETAAGGTGWTAGTGSFTGVASLPATVPGPSAGSCAHAATRTSTGPQAATNLGAMPLL